MTWELCVNENVEGEALLFNVKFFYVFPFDFGYESLLQTKGE